MKLTSKPIIVIGDIIYDEYVRGTSHRLSQEAPVPIIEWNQSESRLGGAANVAANIKSLGGNPILIGAIGNDPEGRRLLNVLISHGIDINFVEVSDRRTAWKLRVISNNQQVARLDREDTSPINTELQTRIANRICGIHDLMRDAGAVVIADYAKGVVTRETLDAVVSRANNIPIFVDPKVRNAGLYQIYPWRTFKSITPNAYEAEGLAPTSDKHLDAIGKHILIQCGCESVLITRGEDGMSLFESTDSGINRTDIPTMAQSVFDVSGAGDTVIAALALAYASGFTMTESAQFANAAAGIVVGKRGTATVSLDEIRQIRVI